MQPADTAYLLHVAHRARAESARITGWYAPAGFDAEGFIHCCRAGQLEGVLERHFRGATDLVLLEIDPALVAAEIREESPPGGAERFPHLYGRLSWSAVSRVSPVPDPAR